MIFSCQKNKINFSANIKFCTVEALERDIKQGIRVSPTSNAKFSVEEAQHGKEIGTLGMLMCNAGGITGGNTNNNLVFHLFPKDFFANLSENFVKVEQKFRETITAIKQEKKEPQALIFGGDVKYDDSKDLLVVLKHFMEKFKINHTIFWGSGKKNKINFAEKNIFYDGKQDTWNVNLYNGGLNYLEKEYVLDAFNYVKVSPKDKIKFASKDWISGQDESLNKGQLDLTIEDVLKKYGVNPEIIGST